jgi:HK97 gp10 family phage protein
MARTIVNRHKHDTRLSRLLSKEAQSRIGKAVYAGADKVRVEARRLIADGAIQGAGHQPSAPGEPPNWEFGDLANGITTRKVGPMQAHTASEAPHSDPLENGTSKMAARPFMSPATGNMRSEVVEDVTNVVNDVIRR